MTPQRDNTKQSIVAAGLVLAAALYALFGVADPPGSTTITNEAVSSYLFRTGQRMVARSNMTETVVQDAAIASVLELTLSKYRLIANGSDTCLVIATVYDVSGNLVPDGQPVAFITTSGTFSGGADTAYTLTVGGSARIGLRSPVAQGSAINAFVTAGTYGGSGRTISRTLPVLFFAAGMTGRVTSVIQRDIRGLVVVASDDAGQEAGRDTVDASGAYFIPINQSGTYSVSLQFRTIFDDEMALRSFATIEVPSSGGVAPVRTLNAIVGSIIDAEGQGPIRKSGIPVMLYSTSSNTLHGGRSLPAMHFTDERGIFVFDSLSAGEGELHVMDVRYSGRLLVPHREAGQVVIDANVAVADAPMFEISKSSNKRIAELGDVITYNIEISNTSTNIPLFGVVLVDELPTSFLYVRGSARSGGKTLADPSSLRRMEIPLADTVAPGQRIKVTYAAQIGAGGLQSKGVNRAYALATRLSGDTVRTLVASVQVVVRPGVFTDRGIVIGKVFYDENENGNQDDGESGLPHVELMMEDGTRVVTGDDGKYSLPEVRAGQHVVRINQLTLPAGTVSLASRTEFAGDGASRFVTLTEGGIARADFFIRPVRNASVMAIVEAEGPRNYDDSTLVAYILKYGPIGTPSKVTLTDSLPRGFIFDLSSVEWKQMRISPNAKPSRVLHVEFPGRTPNTSDTLRVVILSDSTTAGRKLEPTGTLVILSPDGKKTLLAGKTVYEQRSADASEPAAITATTPEPDKTPVRTDPISVLQETSKTVVAEPADTGKTLSVSRKSVQSRVSAKKRTSSPSGPLPQRDTSFVQETPPDATIQQPAPERGRDEVVTPGFTEDSNIGLGVLGTGALLGLLIFFLFWWRRRKREEEKR